MIALSFIVRVEVAHVLRVGAFGLLLCGTYRFFNFPDLRDGYGHAEGAIFPSTQERAQTLQLSAIPGNITFHLSPLLFRLVQ